jgi:hypothetical protein
MPPDDAGPDGMGDEHPVASKSGNATVRIIPMRCRADLRSLYTPFVHGHDGCRVCAPRRIPFTNTPRRSSLPPSRPRPTGCVH